VRYRKQVEEQKVEKVKPVEIDGVEEVRGGKNTI